MYIAMNSFTVNNARHSEFEKIWKERERFLNELDGFVSFKLLRGAPDSEGGETRVYISHSTWASEQAFIDWTKSEQFKRAHKDARTPEGILMGPPRFSGYEVILEEIKE